MSGTVLEVYWKAVLARLRCVVCVRFVESGVKPSLHHIATGSGERSTFSMAPMCEPHHQGEGGLHGLGPKAFIELYRVPGGTEYGILVWVFEDVAKFLRFHVPSLGRTA